MRVFIALDIPEGVRNAVGDFTSRLTNASAAHGVRWLRPQGMHLTLKFVGEATPELVEHIKSQLREIRSAAPVEMRFHGIGFFPSARRPRVLWVGIDATPNLTELADGIEARLETLGIPRESRAFKPHLTLARFDPQKPPKHLGEDIYRLGVPEFGSARAAEFHLFQSVLKRSGTEYTRLESFHFLRPAP